MNTLLNIITITKDDFDGLKSTIQSTRNLRNENVAWQIIIDSSVPEIQEKNKTTIINKNNVHYIWQKPSGISSAFNLGLTSSESEWVWFLNGGDLCHPSLDVNNLIYILSATNADSLIFQIEFMDSHVRHNHPPLWNLWPPLYPNWINHPATIIRRNLFEKFGPFNSNFEIGMDGEALIRFFSKDVVVDLISVPIALFDKSGISHTQLENSAKEVVKILKLHFWIILKQSLSGLRIIFLALVHPYKIKWYKMVKLISTRNVSI